MSNVSLSHLCPNTEIDENTVKAVLEQGDNPCGLNVGIANLNLVTPRAGGQACSFIATLQALFTLKLIRKLIALEAAKGGAGEALSLINQIMISEDPQERGRNILDLKRICLKKDSEEKGIQFDGDVNKRVSFQSAFDFVTKQIPNIAHFLRLRTSPYLTEYKVDIEDLTRSMIPNDVLAVVDGYQISCWVQAVDAAQFRTFLQTNRFNDFAILKSRKLDHDVCWRKKKSREFLLMSDHQVIKASGTQDESKQNVECVILKKLRPPRAVAVVHSVAVIRSVAVRAFAVVRGVAVRAFHAMRRFVPL